MLPVPDINVYCGYGMPQYLKVVATMFLFGFGPNGDINFCEIPVLNQVDVGCRWMRQFDSGTAH